MKYIMITALLMTALMAGAQSSYQYSSHTLYATDTTVVDITIDSAANYVEVEEMDFHNDSTVTVTIRAYTYKTDAQYESDYQEMIEKREQSNEADHHNQHKREIIRAIINATKE